ncbi:MAG TPA: ATP-grasp domain-containing protein [Thermoanaerobaculia bacterium]|nr:ATP-grasp domain-containing protein [Thermoanaerobaculia bacterium]
MPRVLLLLPTTSYRIPDFLAAAQRLGVEVVVASEEASAVEALNPSGLLTLDFGDLSGSAERVAALARRQPVGAVVGVDERTSIAAAAIAERLRLPHNPVSAAAAAGNKARMRELLAAAGVPAPRHRRHHVDDDPREAARTAPFPSVLKPTFLAASRGVIRADDAEAFVAAWERIARLLARPEIAARGGEAAREILVEAYVPGLEVALEGLLTEGALRVLALFDKPDPLEGPFFEETIYVTPSRLPADLQERCATAAQEGARALGLRHGPVHAEMRVNDDGIFLLEIAARSIGGLCARTLRFGTGRRLEEILLAHALGLEAPAERETRSAGVMMIPIPRGGILEEARGVEAARAIPDIVEVTISARLGQPIEPLPEGDRYLGFIFSRAATPERAEAALREAHARLEFRIE